MCLYAGSLVPEGVLAHCPPGARIVNTAPLDLDAIIAECKAAHAAGHDVARLHSGDVSIWSAMGEQIRRLRAEDIPVSVTPGVPAFAAAAAALEAELTLPGLAQSVVLTRTPGRASAMPEGESLRNFAATGATLAIHLSIHNLAQVVADLLPAYGPDCPVAVVYRASWPDQRIVRATLAGIEDALGEGFERTALILVGPALAGEGFDDSRSMPPIMTAGSAPQRRWRRDMSIPGMMISAPSSGTGKTTVMLGLLRALADDGLTVQPFKSGPDYIDPAFHLAGGGPRVVQSRHLGDGWPAARGHRGAGRGRGYGRRGRLDGALRRRGRRAGRAASAPARRRRRAWAGRWCWCSMSAGRRSRRRRPRWDLRATGRTCRWPA